MEQSLEKVEKVYDFMEQTKKGIGIGVLKMVIDLLIFQKANKCLF